MRTIDRATIKRGKEIEARCKAGWRFSLPDWPPMFRPQPWEPAVVISEVQKANMRAGREAANARVRAEAVAKKLRWNGAIVGVKR